MTQIKGAAIRGLLKFVKSSQLPGGIDRVVSELPSEVKPVFERQILSGDWYPYEAYSELLDVMARIHGNGEEAFVETLGRYAARQDLGGIFEAITVLASIPKILETASHLWNRYCDSGIFEIVSIGEEKGIGRITEFPNITKNHAVLLNGWIEGVGLAAGAKTAKVSHLRAIYLGDDHCEFDMRWTT